MSRVLIHLLGPPHIDVDERKVELETRKALALLAYLALKGESQSRESLVALLWPDSDRNHGLAVLRRTLYAINKAGIADCLVASRATIGLVEEKTGRDGLSVDVTQFRAALALWGDHGHPEDQPCPVCLRELGHASDLYRDDFLSGFTLTDSVQFDDWQFFQSESLRSELAVCLTRLVRGYAAVGELEKAISCARRWLSLDRLDEAAHRTMMDLHARMGRRGAAIRQYQECVRVLRQELDAEPLEETVTLYQAIREGAVSSAGDGLAQTPEPQRGTEDSSWAPRSITVVHVRERTQGHAATLADLSTKAAELYGGERLGGPGNLIAFGRVRVREGDPELAVRAALELRRWARQRQLGLSLGVSTGATTMERLGDGVVAAGAAPRMAARLAASALNGQVLVGESTYRTTRSAFEYRPVGMESRTIGRPARLYEAQRLLMVPHKTRGIEGLRARLVGRDLEIAQLKHLFGQAAKGTGHIVTVVAEAGVGKSRLVAELRDHVADRQPEALWLEGRCLELGRGASYWPFLDLLRGFLGSTAEDDLDQASIGSAIRSLVDSGVLQAERSYQIVERISSLFAGTERISENPEQAKHETFLALRDLFQALSTSRPVVMVLEDLHWSDSLSLDLIPMLMESLERSQMLLLCVYRPEEDNRCWRLSTIASRRCPERLVELRLRELTPSQTHDLAASLLQTSELPRSVQQVVLNRSQGNPFFVEEVVRSLIEVGHLKQEGDRWRFDDTSDQPSVEIPQGVRSVILGRVERLGTDIRSTLEVAAVIGALFRRSVLEKVLENWSDLDEALWELERRELIYETRSVPEVEYSFKHVLTQETVYTNMADGRRAALHREVAEALESLHAGYLEQAYEVLALHYERAGDIGRAVDYLQAAGDKANTGYANLEAIAHLSRGLELLVMLPASERTAEREKHFLLSVGTPLVLTAGHAASEIARTYVRAEELCRVTADQDGLFQSVHGSRRFHYARGNIAEARRLSEMLVGMAEKPVQHTRAAFMLGELLFACGRFREGAQACERGLESCRPEDAMQQILLFGNDGECGAAVLASTAWWMLGRSERAIVLAQRAERRAIALDHPFNLVMTLFFACRLYRLLARTEDVRVRAERILSISEERQFTLFHAMALHLSGWAIAQDGNPEQGVGMMRSGLDEWRATGARIFVPPACLYIGSALMRMGRLQQAGEIYREAEEVMSRTNLTAWQAELYRLQAELAGLNNEGVAEVERLLRLSLTVAKAQDGLAWQLKTATHLGKFLSTQKRQTEAKPILAEALSAFTEGFDEPDYQLAQEMLDQL